MLRCPMPDFDLLDYVINNLGFVALSTVQSGALRIKFRPALAAPRGLAAALFSLADQKPNRVVVSHSSEGCSDELFASVGKAIDRVAELTASFSSATHPFLTAERRIEELVGGRDPLSALFSIWAEKAQACELADQADLLNGLLGGRFMKISQGADHLTMDEIGPGFLSHNDKWRQNAVGRPVEDQPDYAYGLWARDLFKSVLKQDKPRFDDIDVIIRRPHLNDKVRLRYQCLILPFRRPASAETYLLCASVIDQAINLHGSVNCHAQKARINNS